MNGIAILLLGMRLDGASMRRLPLELRLAPIRVQRPQSQRGGNRSDLLADRHPNFLQMILELESGGKIAFNIEITAKIAFCKPQRISAEYRRINHLGIAEHQ